MPGYATTLMPGVMSDNNQPVNVIRDTTNRLEHVNQVSI